MLVLKNIILSIVNIAIAFHYGVKCLVLQMIPLQYNTMHSANTIQDNNNDTTEMENEIKRFLHGDDNEDDENIYIPYDGPYSETP